MTPGQNIIYGNAKGSAFGNLMLLQSNDGVNKFSVDLTGNVTAAGKINNLTLTSNAIGFSVAGGTTAKTLNLTGNLTVTGDTTLSGTPLSNPMTAQGQMVWGSTAANPSAPGAIAAGANGQFLQYNTLPAAPAWHTLASSDVGLGNVENTKLSTWIGSANITTVGTIASGNWSGTTIPVLHGGTGLTAGYNNTNWDTAYSLANAATNVNTASAIVKRDASGNFSAGTITGTFSGNLTGNVTGTVSGNAGTVTNGVYTTGSYSNPGWITALDASKITSGTNGYVLTTVGGATAWAAAPGVTSVFGRTGVVAAAANDYAVAQITGAAPAASPTFTGTVTNNGSYAGSAILPKANGGTGNANGTASIAGGTAGAIPYQSAANTTALLAAGSSGQYLVSNGAASPYWQFMPNPSYGSLNYVQKVTGGTTLNNSLIYDNGTNVGIGAGGSPGSGDRLDIEAGGIIGLYSNSSGGVSIEGLDTGSGGTGVYGYSTGSSGEGVYGNGPGVGVLGGSANIGVQGNGGSTGVYGSGTSYGVQGYANGSGWAGYFTYSGSGSGVYAAGSSYDFYGGSGNLSHFSGGVTVGSSGASVQAGDLSISRNSSHDTAALVFGNTGFQYLYYDGTNFQFQGGSLYVNGSFVSSDIRFKKDITPLQDSLSKVLALQGVNFKWNTLAFPEKGFSTSPQVGFIAQEVQKIIPEAVSTDGNGYEAIDYTKITAVLVEATKEQQKQISDQQAQINELKQEVEALQK